MTSRYCSGAWRFPGQGAVKNCEIQIGKKDIKGTVTIRKLDRPVFEWSFSGHNLCPVFECKMAAKAFKNRTGHFLTASQTVLSRIKYFCYDYLINKMV
jgi:hypothetical protein